MAKRIQSEELQEQAVELDESKFRPASESVDDVGFDEDDPEEEAIQKLEKANSMLKKTALLLEFIGDADFCKNITKRERKIIEKQVSQIYNLTGELDETLEELQDE